MGKKIEKAKEVGKIVVEIAKVLVAAKETYDTVKGKKK